MIHFFIKSIIFLQIIGCVNSNVYNNSDFDLKTQEYKQQAVGGPTQLSVNIGNEILKSGGNAMDTILAMQAAIGLSEMHASGLGGGGYILYFDKKSGKIIAFDGRETAPKNATQQNVFGSSGKDETKYRSEFGSQYIATPGILKVMKLAHKQFGSIEWEDIFKPTIEAAQNGFILENRLSIFYDKYKKELPDVANAIKIDKKIAKNIDLANTLTIIANDTHDEFYNGELGNKIVDKVQKSGGLLTKKDLVDYKAFQSDASCVGYKDYKICTRKGNFAILSAIKILEKEDFSNIKTGDDAIFINKIANAVNIAIANKRKYDQDIYQNVDDIVHKIANNDNNTTGTTAFFAIDKQGNIAIIGSSVNGYFGSGVVAEGLVMNNTMLDFSDCVNCTNEIKSGARPSSSISPIIVLDKNNNPVFGVSSAGGIRILSYVTSTLMQMIELGIDPQEAINSIKYSLHNNGTIMFEPRCDDKLKNDLEKFGHRIIVSDEVISGLIAFKIDKNSIKTGYETRRWGQSSGI